MRDLSTTIDRLLAVTPKTEKELIKFLKERKKLLVFCAPEGSSRFWFLMSTYFSELLPTETERMSDWQKKFQYIWVTPIDKQRPEGFR